MRQLNEIHRRELLHGSGIDPRLAEMRGYWSASTLREIAEIGFKNLTEDQIPCLVVPIYCGGTIVSYQVKPDNPRSIDGRLVKYESLPNQPIKIDVGPSIQKMIRDPKIPLYITEGVKKADSAASRDLCCIALAGVWSWRGRNGSGGLTALGDWDGIAINNRTIYIAFDSDVTKKPAVKQALVRLVKFLKSRGAKEVIPVVLPDLGEGKTGLDDYFVSGGTAQGLLQLVDQTILKNSIMTTNRPLPDITADAMEALVLANDPPRIFLQGRRLCRVQESAGRLQIITLNESAVRGEMARSAEWVKFANQKVSHAIPSIEVVRDLINSSDLGEIPELDGLSMCPLLCERKIHTDYGYCESARAFIVCNRTHYRGDWTVKTALDFLIRGLLVDFPFADDASIAHALGLMLLPIVRPAISGPTPMHLINAPTVGSGKTLLSQVCLSPTVANQVILTPGNTNDEEMRKRITSCLVEGRQYVVLDNLSGMIQGDALASCLTSRVIADRLLGRSENATFKNRLVWVATGNNATMSDDLIRRTISIRLNPNMERPHDRSGYTHPDILGFVDENRSKILSALCFLIQHWIDGGCNEWSGCLMGSFESWSRIVGGILDSAGIPGFLGNLASFGISANSEVEAWGEFYRKWYSAYRDEPVKASQLLDLFERIEDLVHHLGDKSEGSKLSKLGITLRGRVDIVVDGLAIRSFGRHNNANQYRIEPVESKGGQVHAPTPIQPQG